jgi:hypothetical protein
MMRRGHAARRCILRPYSARIARFCFFTARCASRWEDGLLFVDHITRAGRVCPTGANLERYTAAFEAAGYDDAAFLAQLSAEDAPRVAKTAGMKPKPLHKFVDFVRVNVVALEPSSPGLGPGTPRSGAGSMMHVRPADGVEVGYCGSTAVGGDCGAGNRGAWKVGPRVSWRAAHNECRQLCRACGRCHYISFSLHRDCSWFAKCDLQALNDHGIGADFRSTAVSRAEAPIHCAPSIDRALRIAKASQCASSLWLDRIAPLLANPEEEFTFVNVRANKGYAVAAALAKFASPGRLMANVTPGAWYLGIREYLERNGVVMSALSDGVARRTRCVGCAVHAECAGSSSRHELGGCTMFRQSSSLP